MKKLVKRSDVMQETLEAYCSCSCSCYGTCSCSTGQTNNSAALFQARYTQFYMDFVAIRMVQEHSNAAEDGYDNMLWAYCHACLIIREEIVCRFFIHLLLVGRGICLMQIQM
ncbi:CLI_3235 family bacteriocin precursor [Roseburia intestinalis]|jgi:putative bacteriocin precursor